MIIMELMFALTFVSVPLATVVVSPLCVLPTGPLIARADGLSAKIAPTESEVIHRHRTATAISTAAANGHHNISTRSDSNCGERLCVAPALTSRSSFRSSYRAYALVFNAGVDLDGGASNNTILLADGNGVRRSMATTSAARTFMRTVRCRP